MSAEFVETAKGFGIPVSRGIRLLDSYADAVGQGTVVWRMGPRAIKAGTEIQQLFMEIMADVTINEATDERRAQNGCSGCSRTADRWFVQRLLWSSR